MQAWWQLLTTDPDEISGEVMCGLLVRVLEGRIDWKSCSGYDLWVVTFSLGRRNAMWNSSPGWMEFETRAQANRDELLKRLDPERPDEATAVLGLLTAGGVRGADIREAVFACLQSPDGSTANAARLYLVSEPTIDAELFDEPVRLLRDPRAWVRQRAAHLLLTVGRRTGQTERALAELDAAARSDPDTETAALMLQMIMYTSTDPKAHIQDWIETDAFSKEVRLETLSAGNWQSDSDSMLQWISPVIESATASELVALIRSLGEYPLVSATAREGFVALIDRCVERGDQAVIDAANILRTRIESADPFMTTDNPW